MAEGLSGVCDFDAPWVSSAYAPQNQRRLRFIGDDDRCFNWVFGTASSGGSDRVRDGKKNTGNESARTAGGCGAIKHIPSVVPRDG